MPFRAEKKVSLTDQEKGMNFLMQEMGDVCEQRNHSRFGCCMGLVIPKIFYFIIFLCKRHLKMKILGK
jgi:hypothetical protein